MVLRRGRADRPLLDVVNLNPSAFKHLVECLTGGHEAVDGMRSHAAEIPRYIRTEVWGNGAKKLVRAQIGALSWNIKRETTVGLYGKIEDEVQQ